MNDEVNPKYFITQPRSGATIRERSRMHALNDAFDKLREVSTVARQFIERNFYFYPKGIYFAISNGWMYVVHNCAGRSIVAARLEM